MAVSPV